MTAPHHCPICLSDLAAFEAGRQRRCPNCGAIGRFRLVWLYLSGATDILTRRARVLHLAPEPAIARRIRAEAPWDYVTADLVRDDVDLRLDAAHIPFGEARFDAVVANHVLEHVVEDRAAVAEFFRVLAPGGWMLLTVPMDKDAAETRLLHPGRPLAELGPGEHKRFYGWDLVGILGAAGFSVRVERPAERFGAGERHRLGIKNDVFFLCTRPQSPESPESPESP